MKNHSSIAVAGLLLACQYAGAVPNSRPQVVAEALRLVKPIENTFTGLPAGGNWCATAAPLMGNGDTGVCLLGEPEALSFMLGKNDFWHLKLGDNETSGVKITSEKGRDCTIVNPWPGKAVRIVRNGKMSQSATGDRFTLKTAVSESIQLQSE